jgi:hypothetical protein
VSLVQEYLVSLFRDFSTIGQGAVRYRRTKTHPIELVWTGAQADFDVGQAFPINDLRESHRQKLIPTRGVIDLVVTGAAIDTATKLFWMDPVSELRKNQFSSGHAPKVGMATA